MEMIYANENREDLGVLSSFKLDMAFGYDENDFELKTSITNNLCSKGYIIYAEDKEYGGIIDSMKVDTKEKSITYSGRTWHGVLDSKVISPDLGHDYYTVSGDANNVLDSIIDRMGLNSLFKSISEPSGITITNYSFDRYTTGYTGIRKMLAKHGAKLIMKYVDFHVLLYAVPIVDYSNNEEFDSDLVDFRIQEKYNPINHVICLGKGELKDRQIVHVYCDSKGNLSPVQILKGMDEVCAIYDNVNAENIEELKKGGIDKISESRNNNLIEIIFNGDSEYDIGDIIGARENITRIFAYAPITKKIVKIEEGKPIMLSYSVSEK